MRFLNQYESFAATILRVAAGAILLAHGVPKLLNIAGFADFMATLPWSPRPLHWIVAISVISIEVLGGLALVTGIRARTAGFLAGIMYLLIALLMHSGQFFLMFNLNSTDQQSYFEFPFLLGVACLAVSFLGPGRVRIRVRDWD
ncbi:MAG: DoxX family protein [Spirochaetia bacterium]|nr:DoxX family protein [Spirochaetia bacterium]